VNATVHGGRHLDELLAMAVTLIVGADRVRAFEERRVQRHPILEHLVRVEPYPPYLHPVFDGRLAPAGRPIPLCWCGSWHEVPVPHRRAMRIAAKWEAKGWLDGDGNRADLSGLTAAAPDGFQKAILETSSHLWAVCAAESAVVQDYLLRFR
jgi:hypothetical protein